MNKEKQYVDLTRKAIAKAIMHSKADVIKALKLNGVLVKNGVSDDNLQVIIFSSMQLSQNFRRDLQPILEKEVKAPDFNNADGDTEKEKAIKDLIGIGLSTGIKLIGDSIARKQSERDRNAAIQYNASEVERLRAEAALAEAKKGTGGGVSNTTIFIVGGVVVALVVVLVVMQKKK